MDSRSWLLCTGRQIMRTLGSYLGTHAVLHQLHRRSRALRVPKPTVEVFIRKEFEKSKSVDLYAPDGFLDLYHVQLRLSK